MRIVDGAASNGDAGFALPMAPLRVLRGPQTPPGLWQPRDLQRFSTSHGDSVEQSLVSPEQ
jgi:hypothetical protein